MISHISNDIVVQDIEEKPKDTRIKIGLLTNEIPPVVYGGVATWIVNFLEMFQDDKHFQVVPIFLAFIDQPDEELMKKKYEDIRMIYQSSDIESNFSDISICINNLWVSLNTITSIKEIYPDLIMVSVCHSLIKMEHLTNMGSCYTSNFNNQEVTFCNSDYVVLISEAEKEYYDSFGYDKYKAITQVIYNSYKPKFDDVEFEHDYSTNIIGYIGRHVPRKRPELPIMSVKKLGLEGFKVYNMGADFHKFGNNYWKKLMKKYSEQLTVIPFSHDKSKINEYWETIGVNCITGIYEPFGYTMCETLDRMMPAIVQDLDGPKEIINEFRDNVYLYEVNKKSMEKDIDSFSKALVSYLETAPDVRKENAIQARKALDRFRPNIIKKDWKELLMNAKKINTEITYIDGFDFIPYLL